MLLVHSSYNSCLVYIAIDVFLFYPAGRFCECVDVGCSFSLQRLVFHYTRRFSSSSFCVCCAVRGGGGLSGDLLPSSLQFSSIPPICRLQLHAESCGGKSQPASYSNCHFSSIAAAAAAAILRAICVLYRLWYHSIRAIHSTTHTYRHAFRLDGIYTQHSSTGAFSPSCKRGFAASGSLYYSLPWWEPMAKREVYT